MITCNKCQFFHTIPYTLEDGTKGENHFCRRYPPYLVNANQSAMPPASPTGWCGEWALSDRKPQVQKPAKVRRRVS